MGEHQLWGSISYGGVAVMGEHQLWGSSGLV